MRHTPPKSSTATPGWLLSVVAAAMILIVGGLLPASASLTPVTSPRTFDTVGSTTPQDVSQPRIAGSRGTPRTVSGIPTSFPRASTTGVPRDTVLKRYRGPCEIRSPRTLSGVDATAKCDALLIRSKAVVIENSRVPRVDATEGEENPSYSVRITRSDVRAGRWSDGALWGYNITAIRVDVTGGQHSFHCNDNCVLKHSWLHGQWNPDGESFHNNAFITNGGTNMLVRHNTLACTAILNETDGGCTADVSLFGDFDPVSRVTIDRNLLRANDSSISYCAYGGHEPSKEYPIATQIVFTDNVFERGDNNKCGVYGPVSSFQRSAEGNVWKGNVWDEGGRVRP